MADNDNMFPPDHFMPKPSPWRWAWLALIFAVPLVFLVAAMRLALSH